jgi:ADP-ribosylglycohydrolase
LEASGQLSLYTADALIEVLEWANNGVYADQAACVWLAFLRWATGQGVALPASAPPAPRRWIDSQPAVRRALPDRPVWVSSLASGVMGTPARPLGSTFDDGAAAARSGPFGLIPGTPAEAVAAMALDAAALAQGHPSAMQSAAAVALLVRELVSVPIVGDPARRTATGSSFSDAAEAVRGLLANRRAPAEDVLAALDVTPEEGARLEDASPAARALAAALEAAIIAEREIAVGERIADSTGGTAPARSDAFEAAVARAADSGSDAAAIAGALLGCHWGEQSVPAGWAARLEGADVASRLAEALAKASGADS